jgi:hypothetical protein
MKFLSNLLLAISLQKKYNFRFSPLSKIGKGSLKIVDGKNFTIKVNPFDNHFKEIFYHELGHLIFRETLEKKWRYFVVEMKANMWLRPGEHFINTLTDEAIASKFSRRAYPQGDINQLLKWFYTYTGKGYMALIKHNIDSADRVGYTDHVVKCINKIRGVRC